jgi:uncharacterized protein (DUF427 family)
MNRKANDPTPGSDHWIHVEESPRHLRVLFGGETLASSRHVMVLREAKCLPVYYFPQKDLHMDRLTPTKHVTHCPFKGEASYWTVRDGNKIAENAAWSYLNPLPGAEAIRGYLAFQWNQMDAWYEEDEEVFVHPRDPYKRVDVLQSSRHVRVILGGETVAETRRPRLLFETYHPTRYYLPKEDVRMDLLEPSETRTRCPYKGIASYWAARIGEKSYKDVVWSYQDPIPECPKIKGLLCFFNERVEAIYVDNERMPVPKTKWSLETQNR